MPPAAAPLYSNDDTCLVGLLPKATSFVEDDDVVSTVDRDVPVAVAAASSAAVVVGVDDRSNDDCDRPLPYVTSEFDAVSPLKANRPDDDDDDDAETATEATVESTTTDGTICDASSSTLSTTNQLSQQQQQSPLRRRRRSVSFPESYEEAIRMVDTIHVTEYTPQEKYATWYTLQELKSFKKERKAIARRYDKLQQQPGHHHDLHHDHPHHRDHNDCRGYDIRGIENSTARWGRIRHKHIVDGINSVLDEQDLQEQDGRSDPDTLAYIYCMVTSDSKHLARVRGEQDRIDAMDDANPTTNSEESTTNSTSNNHNNNNDHNGDTTPFFYTRNATATSTNNHVIPLRHHSEDQDDKEMKTIPL
jgi:hypothetical protein